MHRIKHKLIVRAGLALTSATVSLSGCATAPAEKSTDRITYAASSASQPRAELPSRAQDKDENGFYYMPAGIADDYPEESTTREKILKDLETAKAVGARHLRFAIGWDSTETAPDQYDWELWDMLFDEAERAGITLLPYICYTPEWAVGVETPDYWRMPPDDFSGFADFVEVIATRYRGRVPSWELWNEPDLEFYWLGDAAEFATMIRMAAQRVKKADPSAKVVLGGLADSSSDFLRSLYEEHRIGDSIDILNTHGYLETWNNERAEQYPFLHQETRELIAANHSDEDIWLAEFGYSNFRMEADQVSQWVKPVYSYEHSRSYQGVSLFKHHVLSLASEDLSLVTWYRINDLVPDETVIGDENNKFLGILDTEGDPKPAFFALKFYNQLFDQPVRLVRELRGKSTRSKSHQKAFLFEEKGGDLIVVAWLRSTRPDEVSDTSGLLKDLRHERVEFQIKEALAGERSLLQYRLEGENQEPQTMPDSQLSARLENGKLLNVHLEGDEVFVGVLKKESN